MPFDLVFIGGTGDLAWRKLMPALFQSFRHGKLPHGGRILSVAREDYNDDSYRNWLHARFQDVEFVKRPSEEEFSRFAALVHYLRVDLAEAGDYARLHHWLRAPGDADGRSDVQADPVVLYLATS